MDGRVVWAFDGATALVLARQTRPDLVVTWKKFLLFCVAAFVAR